MRIYRRTLGSTSSHEVLRMVREPLRATRIGRSSAVGALAIAILCAAIAFPVSAQAQGPTDIDELRAARGPFDASLPLPDSTLGHYPGQDFELADWPTILSYLQQLDAASDRLVLEEIGTSAEGQPMVIALISSAANIAAREQYRQIAERLARARDLSEDDARDLAAQGKAIVWIDSGLHATEVAHAQHAPELAYVLAASESDEMRRMREDTIVVLMPNMNPDGLNIVADWYRSNLGTPFETAPLPVLYQKYVGHDNNRDWYMVTQPETKAVTRQLYERWYPQIVYNHHQTAPQPARMFVPPFDDPANPNIPPLVLRGIERVGNAISTRLESEGKSGVVSRVGFTAWWNGGMRTSPYFHNMIGILTETALYRYATPRFYAPDELPRQFRDGTPADRPTMKYPMPWPGGWWRLRDPIEYMLSASIATVDVASRHREEFLLNAYRMARNSITRGEQGSPYGWFFAPEQHDDSAASELVNVLLRGGLDVHVTEAPVEAEGKTYPAGSYFVPASQAFRSYAMDLLEPQQYPDRRLYPGGPPDPPYDMAGWTLPFQMGVSVERLESPVDVASEPLAEAVTLRGTLAGEGSRYLVDPRVNQGATLVNQLLQAGETIHRIDTPTRVGNVELPAGAFLINDSPGLAGRLASLAEETGANVTAVDQRIRGTGWRLRTPRVALYEPWRASMDAGWTRFVMEQFGFDFEVVRDADVRKGGLNARFDALILPSASARQLVDGFAEGTMPVQYTGGLGAAGLSALQDFARQGGTVVALDAAASTAIEHLGTDATNALADVGQDEFFCPGSLLRIQVDNTHPIGFGMPASATAFFVRSQAFELPDQTSPESAYAIATYADSDLLESGWILGEEHLAGHAAVLDVPFGEGRVALLGFRTHFRAQPHETFKLFFNTLWLAAADATALP
ncbi:MAG: peptidase M14 [Acidobacteria bacterium]|nr:peptidase M14 [Acidobacteriota bacterium]